MIGLEGRADTAAHAVARGIRAPDPGTAPAEAIVQRQPKKKTPPRPPPTGGNILYVGMNNFAPEVAALRNFYKGTGVAVTTVTLTQEEKKTQTAATGGTKFDLTTDPGIDDFAKALSLAGLRKFGAIVMLRKPRSSPTFSRGPTPLTATTWRM